MRSHSDRTLLSVRHTADRLDVSGDTVRRLCDAGTLRCIRITEGRRRPILRVLAADLDRFIDDRLEGGDEHQADTETVTLRQLARAARRRA